MVVLTDQRASGPVPPGSPAEPAPVTSSSIGPILDAIEDEVALLDGTGRIVAVNESWRRFAKEHGGQRGAYVGVSYLDHVPPDNDVRALLEELLSGERDKFQFDYRARTPTREQWFQVTGTALPPADSPAASAFLIVHRDITSQRAADEQRQHALAEHMAAKEFRRQAKFSRHVMESLTQEINTPLTPLKLQLHTIAAAKIQDDATKRSLARIERGVRRIDRLVHDAAALMELGRENARLNLEPQDWPQSIVASSDAAISSLNVHDRISVEVSPDVQGAWAALEARWVDRLMHHLLFNAVRFSRPGTPIKVLVMRRKEHLAVAVRDQGIGVSETDQIALTKALQAARLEDIDCRAGMGLAMCARIAALHGGAMGLESPGTGHGATSWFALPAA